MKRTNLKILYINRNPRFLHKEKVNNVTRSCVIKVGGRNTLGLMKEFVFFWNIFKTKRFTKKLKRMKFIALVISYFMDLIWEFLLIKSWACHLSNWKHRHSVENNSRKSLILFIFSIKAFFQRQFNFFVILPPTLITNTMINTRMCLSLMSIRASSYMWIVYKNFR